jgi:transposase
VQATAYSVRCAPASRRLEQATHRKVERLWLPRTRHPDFKTPADFRKDNVQAFTQVFRALVVLWKAWGLYGHGLIAIDGSQFKAGNSHRFRRVMRGSKSLFSSGPSA